MAVPTRTYNFVGGTTATADEVDTDLDALYTELNGNLDDTNLATNAVTTAKITNASVTASKIGTAALQESHILHDFTNGPKLPTFGPNYPTNGAELRIVPFSYSVTSPGLAATADATITFASSTLTYGTFSAFATSTTPKLMGVPTPLYNVSSHLEVPSKIWMVTTTTTAMVIRHYFPDSAAGTALTMYGFLMGEVD